MAQISEILFIPRLSIKSSDSGYEATRQRLRLGPFQSMLLIWISTIGGAIFTYQYTFARVKFKLMSHNNLQAGYVVGLAISFLTCILTIWGITRMINIADGIEKIVVKARKNKLASKVYFFNLILRLISLKNRL